MHCSSTLCPTLPLQMALPIIVQAQAPVLSGELQSQAPEPKGLRNDRQDEASKGLHAEDVDTANIN